MLSEQDLKLAKCTYTFWDKLTPEQQNFLWENLYPVSYQKGDIIHNGEYSCIGVVLIKTGGLRVFMLSSEGKEITLYRLGPQEVCILSASCILQNITFDVCVEAESDTEALLIPLGSVSEAHQAEHLCRKLHLLAGGGSVFQCDVGHGTAALHAVR